ncbi:MAG: dihydroneopterin aldolase [Thermomicrobiaceae bacterium]|nr:dihydroneopterin aldolase [Thermomicrobiaceae bacterium]
MSEDRILLEGMTFFGRHGTLPAERELGQPFVVDIALECDLRAAGESDDLAQTVDYSEVYRLARGIVEGPAVKLTETVAERIAAGVLASQPRVEAVRVRVTKPHVRLEGTVLAGSAIEVVRRRASA